MPICNKLRTPLLGVFRVCMQVDCVHFCSDGRMKDTTHTKNIFLHTWPQCPCDMASTASVAESNNVMFNVLAEWDQFGPHERTREQLPRIHGYASKLLICENQSFASSERFPGDFGQSLALTVENGVLLFHTSSSFCCCIKAAFVFQARQYMKGGL